MQGWIVEKMIQGGRLVELCIYAQDVCLLTGGSAAGKGDVLDFGVLHIIYCAVAEVCTPTLHALVPY